MAVVLTVGVRENYLEPDVPKELVEYRSYISLIKTKIIKAGLRGWIGLTSILIDIS